MPEAHEPSDLKALEAALGRLAPREPRLDRDRLLYLAGQASTRAAPMRNWLWPLATAASLALSATLGLQLLNVPTSSSNNGTPPAMLAERASSGDYLRLRALVLAEGVEALPTTTAPTASERSAPTALRRDLYGI